MNKYTCEKCKARPVDRPEWISHSNSCPDNPINYNRRFNELEERIKKLEK